MMSKKRVISSKTRSSQKFASLTFRQRDLWHGLITIADDQGRLPGMPAYVRSQVFPYDDIKLDEVASDLGRLVDVGSIVIYQVNEADYIQIVNWWKYQAMQWAGSSDHPPPENWIDRERFHGVGNKIFTENWESKGGFSELPSVLSSKLPSELPSKKSYTAREEEVKGNDDELKESAESLPPINHDGWLDEVRKTKNRNATLMFMFETLYPNATEKPDFAYLGRVANVVGGAGRMATLMWECSSKKITGDVMRYIQAYNKNIQTPDEEDGIDHEKQREEESKRSRKRIAQLKKEKVETDGS